MRLRSRSPSSPRSCDRSSASRTAPSWATLAETDWTQTTLDLADPADRELAAHATALGAALFYSFGNFCAIAAHPDRRSVVRVNLVKGRPENQVGSVTTTRDRFDALFDWSLLPDGLSREQVLALIDDFYELGPMGFRGPAAHGNPGPPDLTRRRDAHDAADRARATGARRTSCSTTSSRARAWTISSSPPRTSPAASPGGSRPRTTTSAACRRTSARATGSSSSVIATRPRRARRTRGTCRCRRRSSPSTSSPRTSPGARR